MLYLAMFIFVMCTIAMAFVLVEFWKQRYWLKVNGILPNGAALCIVKSSMAKYKDDEIDALKSRIEKEMAERKVRKEEERIKNAGLQDIAVSRAGLEAGTNTAITAQTFDAQDDSDHQTQAASSVQLTKVGHKHDHKSDEESTDHFEMVGAAEEGRALLSDRG